MVNAFLLLAWALAHIIENADQKDPLLLTEFLNVLVLNISVLQKRNWFKKGSF